MSPEFPNFRNFAKTPIIAHFRILRKCVKSAKKKSAKNGNSAEIRDSISQPLEPKSLYVRNLWIEPVNMMQGVGACGRVWGHVAG